MISFNIFILMCYQKNIVYSLYITITNVYCTYKYDNK